MRTTYRPKPLGGGGEGINRSLGALWVSLAMLALGAVLAVLPGCRARKRAAAGDEYQKELRAHQARFMEFQERYPALERRVAEAREKSPRDVSRIVTEELLPLFDGLAKGYRDVVRSGRAYVALLPSSVKARQPLQRQLDSFEEQQRLMERIRDTYREEAALQGKAPLDRAALEAVYARRGAAASRMQQSASE